MELTDLIADVDSFLESFLEGPKAKPAPKREAIGKTAPRVRPFRPAWKSEALILVTHQTQCACGRKYTDSAGLLIRFRHRDGKTLWETTEHVAAHRPDIPREERIISRKVLYCHECFEVDRSQQSLDLQLWPAPEPLGEAEREAIDSQLSQPLE